MGISPEQRTRPFASHDNQMFAAEKQPLAPTKHLESLGLDDIPPISADHVHPVVWRLEPTQGLASLAYFKQPFHRNLILRIMARY